MKTNLLFSIISGSLLALSLILMIGCSDLKTDLPSPVTAQLKVHEDGWIDPKSAHFHGNVLKDAEYKFDDCVSCHSKQYTGGTSGVSCFKCHQLFPHLAYWSNPSEAMYHGSYLKLKNWQLTECTSCHGASFDGGTSGVACSTCHQPYPHVAGWDDPATSSSHGKYLKTKSWQLAECSPCHGSSFTGGTSEVSCFTCHQTFPHSSDWSNPTKATYHGNYLKLKNWQLTECTSCHGASFDGGASGVKCSTCHQPYPHVTGWDNPAASSSHGKYLKTKSWQLAECSSCHGTSFTGGTSGQSCYACHQMYPHPAGFAGASGHPVDLYAQNYPLAQCQTCHGSSYAGGSVVNVSCSKSGCHVDLTNAPKSPEVCNTCHGDFNALVNDVSSFAPPKSVVGESAGTARGVGAHQKHLATGVVGKSVKCQECHTVPTQLSSPGHLGTSLPAEVVFNDTLAHLATAGGTYVPKPSYDPSALRCNNTYCHGNWKLRRATSVIQQVYTDSVMTGSNPSPIWTGGAGEASCGSCHGLPPTGHIDATVSACATCHRGVVNSAGIIVDKTKHINGKVNVFGVEYSF